jgi:hypothetical protein
MRFPSQFKADENSFLGPNFSANEDKLPNDLQSQAKAKNPTPNSGPSNRSISQGANDSGQNPNNHEPSSAAGGLFAGFKQIAKLSILL